jgi:hypothetical protein
LHCDCTELYAILLFTYPSHLLCSYMLLVRWLIIIQLKTHVHWVMLCYLKVFMMLKLMYCSKLFLMKNRFFKIFVLQYVIISNLTFFSWFCWLLCTVISPLCTYCVLTSPSHCWVGGMFSICILKEMWDSTDIWTWLWLHFNFSLRLMGWGSAIGVEN